MAYFLSVLFILLGAPLAMKAIGPNRWYGFRTARTLGDREVWYSVNVLGGKALIAAGIASLVGLVLLGQLWAGDPETGDSVAILIPLGLLTVAIVVALVGD